MGAETTVAFDAAVLTVARQLDASVGMRLLDEAQAAVRSGATRLDVDLCDVVGFTPAGAAALLACRDLRVNSDDSRPVEVHYRTSRGAGREALLAAFAGVCDNDGPHHDGPSHDGHGGPAVEWVSDSLVVDRRTR